METLSAKVLPRSSSQTKFQRVPFHPLVHIHQCRSIPVCSSAAYGQQIVSSRVQRRLCPRSVSPAKVRVGQLSYLSLEA